MPKELRSAELTVSDADVLGVTILSVKIFLETTKLYCEELPELVSTFVDERQAQRSTIDFVCVCLEVLRVEVIKNSMVEPKLVVLRGPALIEKRKLLSV